MSRSVVGLLVLCCFLGTVAAAADDPIQKDLAMLQGTWRVKSAIRGGKEYPGEDLAQLSFIFKGDELISTRFANDFLQVKLDPSKKPAAIDLVSKKDKPAIQGIYEIDGDTLKLCWNHASTERPRTFTSAAGSGTIYLVLKRVKK